MKKLFFLVLAISIFSTISYSELSQPDRNLEKVIRPDGTSYYQCINPGSNCAV